MSGSLKKHSQMAQPLLKVAVIHWFPVEYYPPVTNCMNFFAAQSGINLHCYSSTDSRGREPYVHPDVKIVRFTSPSSSDGRLKRLAKYLWFPIAVFFHLMRLRPDCVLYYEPQSSVPALLYSAINWRCRIMIHHHEYHDPEQFFRPGMRLARLYHWLEKCFLFRRAKWISHTNERRLELFHTDHPTIDSKKLKVLANYPPIHWQERSRVAKSKTKTQAESHHDSQQLKLVYVGSVSMHDTFIQPLVDWIVNRSDNRVTLDVYAYNADEKTKTFLKDVMTPFTEVATDSTHRDGEARPPIRYFQQGIDYNDLPEELARYDVGVILYRCNTTNYKYNASNKLFEYLACGLEVWYPPQMLGVKPYSQDDVFPRVMEVDYDRLNDLDLNQMESRNHLPAAVPPPNCEQEFQKLAAAINKS